MKWSVGCDDKKIPSAEFVEFINFSMTLLASDDPVFGKCLLDDSSLRLGTKLMVEKRKGRASDGQRW